MSQKPSGPHLPQTPLILSPRKNESVLIQKKKKPIYFYRISFKMCPNYMACLRAPRENVQLKTPYIAPSKTSNILKGKHALDSGRLLIAYVPHPLLSAYMLGKLLIYNSGLATLACPSCR